MTQRDVGRPDSPSMASRPSDESYQTHVVRGGEFHLLDYIKVLHKRRRTAMTVFLVVVLTGVVYTFTQTPIYEARARLLIEIDNPNVVQFQQVLEENASRTSDYRETQYQLLQSRSLIRRTLDQADLWDDQVFLGATQHGGFSVTRMISDGTGTLISLAGQGLQFLLQTPSPLNTGEWDEGEETLADSRAIDVFLHGFSATPVRSSRLVDISYRSTHPRLAATVINTHADAFIDQNLEFQFLTSRDATDWLGEQLTEQRRVVEESEVALHRYREEHDAVSLEDRENIVVQRLAELSAAHTRARTEVIAKEASYRQLEAIESNPDAIDALPAVVSNRFIQEVRAEVAGLRRQRAELAENLGVRHPDMIKVESATATAEARLQIEIDKVAESIRNEFRAAQAQERSLARELDLQKNESLAMNEMGIGYGVLARDAESNRQIYGNSSGPVECWH